MAGLVVNLTFVFQIKCSAVLKVSVSKSATSYTRKTLWEILKAFSHRTVLIKFHLIKSLE